MSEKKKFKDTKLGGLLKSLAPKILDVAYVILFYLQQIS